ncbi:hypothetical protein KSP40_PGU017223 [Platanthera guangdongensis]|uniref:Uncharacterized protein n=1 Tax=Platanthera guangdongensis TaxID=2320717 RepID=A0ABR2M7U3_9ASPA
MAVTHDDLSLRNNRAANNSSRPALSLMVMSVLCGLAGFIFCMAGEASRSKVTWTSLNVQNSKGPRCSFSGSGAAPFGFAAAASILFVAAFILECYGYLRPVSRSLPPAIRVFACIKVISIFISEILLAVPMYLESRHLYDWTKPRLTCYRVIPRLFTAAGLFGLTNVFLGIALYVTAHITHRLLLEENMGRRQHPQPSAPSL